jgi:hypothetical protein
VPDGPTWCFRTAARAPVEIFQCLIEIDYIPLLGSEADFAGMTAAGRMVQLAAPSVIWGEAGRQHTVESTLITIEPSVAFLEGIS